MKLRFFSAAFALTALGIIGASSAPASADPCARRPRSDEVPETGCERPGTGNPGGTGGGTGPGTGSGSGGGAGGGGAGSGGGGGGGGGGGPAFWPWWWNPCEYVVCEPYCLPSGTRRCWKECTPEKKWRVKC